MRLYILQRLHKYTSVEKLDAKWKQTAFSYLAIQRHFVASGSKGQRSRILWVFLTCLPLWTMRKLDYTSLCVIIAVKAMFCLAPGWSEIHFKGVVPHFGNMPVYFVRVRLEIDAAYTSVRWMWRYRRQPVSLVLHKDWKKGKTAFLAMS